MKTEHELTTPNKNLQPKIARIWRGRTTSANADEYAAYNYEIEFKPLLDTVLGAEMFREDREGETEFMTIPYWVSRESMARFAGDDPPRIHHLPRDPELLIELPDSVQGLDIVSGEWQGFPSGSS
jgi:hypothetical protein